MKLSTWACAWVMTGCLLMGDAMAQQLRHPVSVQPAGFDYNRYLQDEASPSDAPAPVAEGTANHAPVVHTSSLSASCDTGCDTECDSGCDSGCDSCCSTSCVADWCDLGDAFTISESLFGECSPWTAGGWVQAGYTSESTGLFNNLPGQVYLNQSWAYLEREADGACGWDWGFRADIMYGTDGSDTQAFGNQSGNWDYENGFDHGDYSWAIPQLYGVLQNGDLSVKLGHFYTLIGYEVVGAPDNFFYSHAYTMYNSEPFTHTGALATYTVSDNLEVYGGWTAGWDTGFDQLDGGSNFLGGFSAALMDDLTLIYITTIGDFGWRGEDGYMHSIVLDATLTDNLNYVFQSDYLRVASTGEDNVGINQYLFYTVSDCVAVGGRVEWWKTDPLNGEDLISVYEATFGVNIRPHANLMVRPEIRKNWAPSSKADAAVYDGVNDTIFGIDAIVTF